MTMSDKNKLHPIFSKNIDALKKKNKVWKFKFFDDNERREFIEKNYDHEFVELYDSIDPNYGAARADYFRYLLIYKMGGIYLDVKSSCNQKFDDVINQDDEFILSRWSNKPKSRYFGWGRHASLGWKSEFQQWHVIAKPGHPFLKAVIDRVTLNLKKYQPLRDGVGKFGVLNLTGPIAYTNAISPIKNKYHHRLVDIEDLGFDYSIIRSLGSKKKHSKFMTSNYRKLIRPIIKMSLAKTLKFYFVKYSFKFKQKIRSRINIYNKFI